MKQQSKLTPQEQEQQNALQHKTEETSPREFSSVEAMLRHDALHTPVPPTIAHRLKESIGPAAPRQRPWWRKLFNL